MLSALLAIATFRVVPIALPASYGISPFNAGQGQSGPPGAIGANGSVAVMLTTAGGAARIGIVRPNGTTTYLPLPALADIKRQIAIESPPTFGSVVLASDGTPFVSVASCFEAVGGGGCNDALFVWTGAWHALPHPPSNDDFTIAGAETSGTYVLEDDYGNRSATDSHDLPPPHASLYRGGKLTVLGNFTATSMRGNYVSATESTETNVMDPPTPQPVVSHAIAFEGGVKAELGLGTASAVNARGELVGTDAAGRPVLWSNGTEVVLSPSKGSADAVNDAGLIAGMANSHLFLTDARDPTHRIYALDDLLADRTWHVDGELGIANDGRILVIANRGKHPQQLMLLEPVRASP